MSQTSTIIAEMRAANAKANADFSDRMYNRDREFALHGTIQPSPFRPERYALATTKGRNEASTVASVLLKGTGQFDRNAVKREHSLPKRAMSMAARKGRVTPDMLGSLMAFFASPGSMATQLLNSFLPERVSTDDAKAFLSDPFVVDVIEGLGFKVPTAKEAVALVKNPATTRAGRAPGRVIIADGVTPATVPTGKRGRPSGPKFVEYLRPTADVCEAAGLLLTGPAPIYGCTDLSGLPGGNDVMHGAGRLTHRPEWMYLEAYHAEAAKQAKQA